MRKGGFYSPLVRVRLVHVCTSIQYLQCWKGGRGPAATRDIRTDLRVHVCTLHPYQQPFEDPMTPCALSRADYHAWRLLFPSRHYLFFCPTGCSYQTSWLVTS